LPRCKIYARNIYESRKYENACYPNLLGLIAWPDNSDLQPGFPATHGEILKKYNYISDKPASIVMSQEETTHDDVF